MTGPHLESRRVYIVGDAKTTNLGEKFMQDLEHRPGFATDMEQFEEVEMFSNTFHRMIIEPDDWHAGMAFLQAGFNVF